MPSSTKVVSLYFLSLLMSTHLSASASVAEKQQNWLKIISTNPKLQAKILQSYSPKTYGICWNVGAAFLSSEMKGAKFNEEIEMNAGLMLASTMHYSKNSKFPENVLNAELRNYTQEVKADMNAYVNRHSGGCMKLLEKMIVN